MQRVAASVVGILLCIIQANCQDPGAVPRPRPHDEMADASGPGTIGLTPELGKIFGELSWMSRLQLLDQYYPSPNKTVLSSSSLMQPIDPNNPPGGIIYYPGQLQPQKLRIPPGARRHGREVGLAALKMPKKPVAGRRQTPSIEYPPTNPPVRDDDTSMKLKLFRLMYETVRDSDLKVKRAELIKTQYVNSSAFEVGYLLGDISDKYNIMSDIAMTLKRLYADWRPIEHINAYEQIANQAIEISHLIDLAKTVHKRNERSGNDNDPIKNNKNNNAP